MIGDDSLSSDNDWYPEANGGDPAIGIRGPHRRVKQVGLEGAELGPQTSQPPHVRGAAPDHLAHLDAKSSNRLGPVPTGGQRKDPRLELLAIEMAQQLVQLVLGTPLGELTDHVGDATERALHPGRGTSGEQRHSPIVLRCGGDAWLMRRRMPVARVAPHFSTKP